MSLVVIYLLRFVYNNTCRIAFHGKLLQPIDNQSADTLHAKLRIYKLRTKQGQIERLYDAYTLIGKNLFKKETDMNLFVNMKVTKENGMLFRAYLC